MTAPPLERMQLVDGDRTAETSVNADTEWSPPSRPDMLAGLEQRKQR